MLSTVLDKRKIVPATFSKIQFLLCTVELLCVCRYLSSEFVFQLLFLHVLCNFFHDGILQSSNLATRKFEIPSAIADNKGGKEHVKFSMVHP